MFLGACGRAETPFARPTVAAPVVTVGAYAFDAGDVRLRRQIIAVRYGEESDLGAVAQLVHGYLHCEALRRLGAPVTEEALARECERIDGSTKDPATLSRIKSACGDARSYREIFVLPDFANSRYHFAVAPALEGCRPAEERFWEAVADVPVWIADGRLRDEFRRGVSWASRVRLVP